MPTAPLSRYLSVRRLLRTIRTPPQVIAPAGTYSTLREPPSALLAADGSYQAGWFRRSPKDINISSAGTRSRRYHRWFFVHFDSDDYFVSANLIDLQIGGNAGIVVLNKRTGVFSLATETRFWRRNFVKISPDCREFHDARGDRFIRIAEDDSRIDFDLVVKGMSLKGSAASHLQPFVQTTAFEHGRGTHQQWGNMTLINGRLSIDGKQIELQQGSAGAYDRSFGHRRLLENWNWIIASGMATSESGKTVPFALQAAHDRSLARPVAYGQKYALWIGDHFLKLPSLSFEYDYVNRRTLDTTAWKIFSPRGEGNAFVDLQFDPHHHRCEQVRVPLAFHVDHSNYFGALNGEVVVNNERFEIRDVFAATEDSMMVL